jgi:tRNA A-37 threonylcarbamoyl transferase component Bud32
MPDHIAGSGTAGLVYKLCVATDCTSYVAKAIQLNRPGKWKQTPEQFLREVEMSQALAALQLGPQVLAWQMCADDQIGIIVMERLDVTLHQYVVEDPTHWDDALITRIERQAQRLVDAGYFNGDFHSENIMLKLSNGQVRFIDARAVRRILPFENREYLLAKMLQQLADSINNYTFPRVRKGVKRQAQTQTQTQTQSVTPVKRQRPADMPE